MFCRLTEDGLLYVKTRMARVVFRHERWLPSVVPKLGKWSLQKLGASGKINKYSCHWGSTSARFYPLPTSIHHCAGYICLELASKVFILHFPISHPPLLRLLVQNGTKLPGSLEVTHLPIQVQWKPVYWALIRSGAVFIFIALWRAYELLRNTSSNSRFYTAT